MQNIILCNKQVLNEIFINRDAIIKFVQTQMTSFDMNAHSLRLNKY